MKTTYLSLFVVALLVVGGVAWYVLKNPAATTGGLNTNNPSSGIPADQSGGATGVPSQATQAAPLNIASAYASLFGTLQAQKVAWTRASSVQGEYGDLYALFADDIAQAKKDNPTERDFSIGVSKTDLNADGTAEALVYEDLPGWCGTGGCPLLVYQKQQGKWQPVLQTLAYEIVGIGASKTAGYNDLFVSLQGGAPGTGAVVRFGWSGSAYAVQKSVAAWDGTAFKIGR